MSFDQFWEALQTRNPALLQDAPLTIRPANFRDALQQAYQQGELHEKEARSMFDFRVPFEMP